MLEFNHVMLVAETAEQLFEKLDLFMESRGITKEQIDKMASSEGDRIYLFLSYADEQ